MLIKEILASFLLSCYIEKLVIFKGTIRGVSVCTVSLLCSEKEERERETELSGLLKQSHSSSSRASSVCVGDSLAHLNYPSQRNREGEKISSSNQWFLQQPENKGRTNNEPFESKFDIKRTAGDHFSTTRAQRKIQCCPDFGVVLMSTEHLKAPLVLSTFL